MKKLLNINRIYLLCGISLFVFFLFLVLRNTGLYPSIFADEYTYSKLARLTPLAESTIPNYLYLTLFNFTNYCGDGFLGCAKIINSFLFVAAAPFIYWTARRLTSEVTSAYLALLALMGPINSYTAYFMPESFYFLSFWIVSWYFLGLDCKSGNYRWFMAGVIFAISALIKPHSLLFLPAIFLFVVFVFYRTQGLFSKACGGALFSLIAGLVLVKFSVSYVLAGSSGLTIFGPFYGATVSTVSSGSEKYIGLLLIAFESLKGHLLVLGLIYGLPLVLVAIALSRALLIRNQISNLSESSTAAYEKLSFFSFIVILNLICVVVLFTASIANSGPYETPYRLLMRYYNFALPLFYLIVAGALEAKSDIKRPLPYLLGGLLITLIFFVIRTNLEPYTLNHIDSPEIRGLYVDRFYFRLVSGFLLLAVALWIFSQRNGLRVYLYLALPLFVVVSTYHVGLELWSRLSQDVYDKAGIFTKQYVTDDDLPKTVVVGSEAGGLFRSLYYLDHANASLDIIQRGAEYDLTKLTTEKKWVLLIGDHELKGLPFYKIPMPGFTLVRVSGEYILDFKRGVWPGVVKKVQGLSTQESWGTWSQSDVVTFEFEGSLPSHFEIHLIAHAFSSSVGKGLVVSIGDSFAQFSLSKSEEQKIIRLVNPNGLNLLRFKIPNAETPKSLLLSDDERKLGIGFIEMRIVPID